MPPPETSHRTQYAVYWERVGVNRYGEADLDASPVELKVRWERGKHQIRDGKGNTIGADFGLVVAEELTVGSIIWLGKLINWSTAETDYYEIIASDTTPDIKGRQFQRNVSLARYTGTLPGTIGT